MEERDIGEWSVFGESTWPVREQRKDGETKGERDEEYCEEADEEGGNEEKEDKDKEEVRG